MPQLTLEFIMSRFKTIGLIGRPGHKGVVDSLYRLIDYLQSMSVAIVLENATAELLDNHQQQTCDSAELGRLCELVIVVGGDGSMLNAAQKVVAEDVPVIGINRVG